LQFLIKIAFKNLRRHRLRTAVSILVIAFAVLAIVFTYGTIEGFLESTYSLSIQYDTGHMKIIDQEYKQKEKLLSLNYTVNGLNEQDLQSMEAGLKDLAGIEMVIPRIKFGASYSKKNEMVEFMGWGIDPAKELEFTDIGRDIIEGRMVEAGTREVLMGYQMLENLNKEVGDSVTLLYTTSYSSFQGATFKIVGKIKSGATMLNEDLFYLPLTTAQNLLYLEGQVTELLLVTENFNQVDKYVEPVKRFISAGSARDKYLVEVWNQAGGFVQYMAVAESIYNLIYLLIIVLASFVVINTFVMIVKERTHEIGMMAALGLKSREILTLFLLEGFLMAVIGSSIGAVGGGFLTSYLADVGLNYGAVAVEGMDVLMNPIVYPKFSFYSVFFAFTLGVIVTTLTAVFPARRAAKMNPTDALRDS
jgi:putative ABC transport system permease protein